MQTHYLFVVDLRVFVLAFIYAYEPILWLAIAATFFSELWLNHIYTAKSKFVYAKLTI